jgi:hypothetical protein
MAQAEGDPDVDALAWYKAELVCRSQYEQQDSCTDTLRHLIELGMRESSGVYCEGRCVGVKRHR